MNGLNEQIIVELRAMARRGESVHGMFNELQRLLGESTHIATILHYMRAAFTLNLAETKPIAALSRNDVRTIEDPRLLEELVMPRIQKNRPSWDQQP